MWLEGEIPSDVISQTMADWDNHQLNFIPEVSRDHALKIRASFDQKNWLLEKDEYREQNFRFIGTQPQSSEVDAEAESRVDKSQYSQVLEMCLKILAEDFQKTLESIGN